ncbi:MULTISPECIES: envelope stress response membrane protein PspB [unclassified Motilimonas]|jgi:phage shock protein B|uniref:envelope stress response membrane protein PspB n=1 Tax=unclassified Motilimonas TaxID=2643697 RepID=UPI001E2F240D|nr:MULTISPECIES: envelope stress response membrane protein PspB [unclassified Motilimonas]MCE0557600.1 envelope stress response membrane protein PspB [Motilimonas sp. E26]MDO6526277.1 envelope stress response membrane protein PspB [Motilimonas sp. 1_MG-2023]
MSGFMVVPIIVFLVIVAPLWLILHYRSRKQLGEGLSVQETAQLNQLIERAEKLQQRVHTLESILDVEAPSWRNQ